MAYLNCLVLVVGMFGLSHFAHGQLVVPPVNIRPSYASCLEVKEIVELIRSNIGNILGDYDIHVVPECGDGLCYRVAYLNMTNPSQQCPPAWREYNTNGMRACGRPVTNSIEVVQQPFIPILAEESKSYWISGGNS